MPNENIPEPRPERKASKADAWMPLYIADYLTDTTHLTTEQHGAYLLLLMAAWKRGGSLPRDPAMLAAITGLSRAVWRKHENLLLEFFAISHDKITHKRVTAEAAKARELSEKRQAAGLLGGRPGKPAESKPKANGLANVKQNETPSPSPLPLKKEGSNEPAGQAALALDGGQVEKAKADPWANDQEFKAAWDACPPKARTRSSKRAAWAEWQKAKRRAPGVDLAAAMRRYAAGDDDAQRGFAPGFHLWLKADKFEHWDGPAAAASAPKRVTFV